MLFCVAHILRSHVQFGPKLHNQALNEHQTCHLLPDNNVKVHYLQQFALNLVNSIFLNVSDSLVIISHMWNAD